MNEKKAREIIGDEYINDDNSFTKNDGDWSECMDSDSITLDGYYSTEELKAFIWWMENKL